MIQPPHSVCIDSVCIGLSAYLIAWLRGSGSRPPLEFLFFGLKLFNFEFELHRSTPLAFFERCFLFHVSVDEQVLDFSYPGPFFGHKVGVLLHDQPPSKLFWESAISSWQCRLIKAFVSQCIPAC
jgi:hypothetical protein